MNLVPSFDSESLDEKTIEKDPLILFAAWFDKALHSEIIEPNAMTLATADGNGRPSARMVLLKSFDDDGFVFYTNYESRKGVQLSKNPFAALIFWWAALARQVRIEGRVKKLSSQESDAYFASRPQGHQLSSLSSEQSRIIPNYSYLEERHKRYFEQFLGKKIPRPEYWGGYRLLPFMIEFWQGRPNRLHDRLRFTKQKLKDWKLERLAP